MVGWSSSDYATLAVRPIKTSSNQTRALAIRMRDALIERTLAGSGLRPIDQDGDLILDTEVADYTERVIATGIDGRTERLQYTLVAHFTLTDRVGRVLWSLRNYRYSDQFAISTTQAELRNEEIYEQDKAMQTMADLVITNISLAIIEDSGEDDE